MTLQFQKAQRLFRSFLIWPIVRLASRPEEYHVILIRAFGWPDVCPFDSNTIGWPQGMAIRLHRIARPHYTCGARDGSSLSAITGDEQRHDLPNHPRRITAVARRTFLFFFFLLSSASPFASAPQFGNDASVSSADMGPHEPMGQRVGAPILRNRTRQPESFHPAPPTIEIFRRNVRVWAMADICVADKGSSYRFCEKTFLCG